MERLATIGRTITGTDHTGTVVVGIVVASYGYAHAVVNQLTNEVQMIDGEFTYVVD